MNEITNPEQGRNLAAIAVEINAIKASARTYITNSCIEIGRRLVEAKAMVPHGGWAEWLKDSVDYSERTAQNLMKIYTEYGAKGNQGKLFGQEYDADKVKQLGYTKLLTLLDIKDDDDRAEFMNNSPVEDMSVRELENKIKELNASKEKSETEKAEAEKDRDFYRKQAADERARAQAEKEKLTDSLNKAQNESDFANQRLHQAEKELEEIRNRPIETAVVHEIPEETKQEMAAMREELDRLRQKGTRDENEIRFAMAFENTKKDAQLLIGAMEAIRDEGKREHYREATRKFLEIMLDMAAGEAGGH